MKVEKGQAGYLQAQKRRAGLQVFIGFGLVAAILIAGYLQTHSKLNLFTVVAILGCLPASKALVGLITILPHKTIEAEKAEEIKAHTNRMTCAYDLVITSREKIMPVDAVVVSGNTVFGYTSNPKTDPQEVSSHIKNMLAQNRYSKITVKVFADYTAFLSRIEGLDNMLAVDESLADKKKERAIRRIILNISM